MEWELEEDLPSQSLTEQNQEEHPLKTAAKTVGRLGSRVAETIAGTPGDILSAGFGGLNMLGKAIGDKNPIPSYQEIQEKLPVSIPTSSDIKGFVQEKLPWTKPEKGSWGEVADRSVETIASLVSPDLFSKGNKLIAAGKGIRRALLPALGSEMTGFLAKELGADESTQDKVRMASLIGLQLKGTRSATREQASQNYKTAEKLAKDSAVDAPGLLKWTEDADKFVKSGVGSKDKGRAYLQPLVDEIKGKFKATEEATSPIFLTDKRGNVVPPAAGASKHKSISVNDAVQTVQDLREKLRSGEVPYDTRYKVHEMIDSLKDNVIKPFSKNNPEFGHLFNSAEEAWAALNKDTKFSNFVGKHFSQKPWASRIMGGIMHAGTSYGAHHLGQLATVAPILGAGLAANEFTKFMKLLKNSSIAQDTASKFFKASLAGNVAVAGKMANKLDKMAAKFEGDNPDESEAVWEFEG